MKRQLEEILQGIVDGLGGAGVSVDVAVSDGVGHGDYTTNVALKLAKPLKKSPMEIALQVKKLLEEQKTANTHKERDQKTSNDNQNSARSVTSSKELQDNVGSPSSVRSVLDAIDRVDVAPPGFVNLFLKEQTLSSQVFEVLKDGEAYGKGQTATAKRVTVEFTDPNPFKEFHIGHLYSNSVGESVSRLLESQGHTVRRVNYQGDVGMHVAKALYGLLKPEFHDAFDRMGDMPLAERAQFLGKAYAVGAKAFEEDKTAAEDMKTLNKLAFIAAQVMWEREKGQKPVVDYRGTAPIDEKKLAMVAPVYEKGRAWSLAYFETIYARLGTKFAGYYFESAVGERGIRIVREHVKDGVFEESDGAVIYRGEKKGLHTRVFINQLGLPTYETKELGLAPTKYDDWNYDLSVIVTGNEINEYFKVLLSALADVAPELAEKTRHMGHGMVRKADGTKMSSRSGDVLTGEGLLNEVKDSIYKILDKNKSAYEKDEHERIAEAAAVAAVKYSLLRVSLPSDVAFDAETSVSFDGDSGPYLLYSYARCKSVIRKAAGQKADSASVFAPSGGEAVRFTPEEKAIARLISFFPETVEDAAENLSPNVLCTYLFKLAQAYNEFYQKTPILGQPETSWRLTLTQATAQVIKNGLYLLGISTVERM